MRSLQATRAQIAFLKNYPLQADRVRFPSHPSLMDPD